jgi:hypothetical protein
MPHSFALWSNQRPNRHPLSRQRTTPDAAASKGRNLPLFRGDGYNEPYVKWPFSEGRPQRVAFRSGSVRVPALDACQVLLLRLPRFIYLPPLRLWDVCCATLRNFLSPSPKGFRAVWGSSPKP